MLLKTVKESVSFSYVFGNKNIKIKYVADITSGPDRMEIKSQCNEEYSNTCECFLLSTVCFGKHYRTFTSYPYSVSLVFLIKLY